MDSILISEDRKDYKCFDLLKDLLSNEKFKSIIDIGVNNGYITGFDDELWDKIDNQNIRTNKTFTEHFEDGINIGSCTSMSRQLSYSFDSCYICGGILPILKGTKNSIDGSHTWILTGDKIIDTSLMLVIDKDYANELGYVELNRVNPNMDEYYRKTKEYTNDTSLNRKR